ncbi:dihydrolipoamide acetyltransferase family protein [Kouleothrix sp.]|uniref:dihydrolipoamide acetyltransferase family protein n=1 Tax=Kouleothrix sp. TaxID=2779161 RepID=UPI00391B91CF
MPKELFIPQLGQTVEQVTLVRWLQPDGAALEPGQEVLEVETDKAIFAIEATAKGYLRAGPFQPGQQLPVLTVVALIGAADDRWPAGGAKPATIRESAADAQPAPAADPAPPIGTPAAPARRFVSPRARNVAATHGVDLALVRPSGDGGRRVVERDVRAYLAEQQQAQAVAAPPPAAPSDTAGEVIERVPLAGVRGVIAGRMLASAQATARVTLFTEVDATEFVAVMHRLRARVRQEWGFPPAYSHVVAKIAAAGLRKYPYLNARVAGDAIERLARVNIGMAVDSERGLIVPVLHDADRATLRELGARMTDLLDQIKHNRIRPADLSGGTFTISDLSATDVDAFTPIINLPEAAILGLGRIVEKPVVRDGQVVPRSMWSLSLAFDHRVTDGAPAAKFLRFLKERIEEPYLLIGE